MSQNLEKQSNVVQTEISQDEVDQIVREANERAIEEGSALQLTAGAAKHIRKIKQMEERL